MGWSACSDGAKESSPLMNVTWADEARRHSMENDIIVQNEANIYCVINSLQNLILL